MRLDKYLKVARILKRRTVAKELALHERIKVNDSIAKPSTLISIGDIIEIQFGTRNLKIRVLEVVDYSRKEDASMLYEVIED